MFCCFIVSQGLLHLMQEWAVQLSERNWRNAVLLHNTNLFLHDWLKRAALKEGFCAFCCRSAPLHSAHLMINKLCSSIVFVCWFSSSCMTCPMTGNL